MTEALTMVRAYSTTWYEPIMKMPPRLNEACTGTYLMLRAIDEVEDHPVLPPAQRAALLRQISIALQTQRGSDHFDALMAEQRELLPDVTRGLARWAALIPQDIAARVYEAIAAMADRMAEWVLRDFRITSRLDLDRYTYAVGGASVLVFSDLSCWYDGAASHRSHGIALGRFLQAVNILVDRDEDAERGVDFLPTGWRLPQMFGYVHDQEGEAAAYVDALAPGPAKEFFTDPHRRAQKALRHLEARAGEPEDG